MPLTDVSVFLGWFGGATRFVHYGAALAAPLRRLPGVPRALDEQAQRIQRGRAEPGTGPSVHSDVMAVASDGTAGG